MKRALALSALLFGCARAAPPLAGVPAPDRTLPSLALTPGHRHVVFKWDYEEGAIAARGDGSVRTAAPDSARLDFFLGGGLGAGASVHSAHADDVGGTRPPCHSISAGHRGSHRRGLASGRRWSSGSMASRNSRRHVDVAGAHFRRKDHRESDASAEWPDRL